MPSNTPTPELKTAAMINTRDGPQSRLLSLPVELQLIIYEYTIFSAEPLLINGGCSASFQEHGDDWRDYTAWRLNQGLWSTGERTAPFQPGLTRTCRFIRDITIPMFYQGNAFRAHYCEEVEFKGVARWFGRIGRGNREMLKDFCIWDLNPDWDWQEPNDLRRVKESKVLWKMGGSVETISTEEMCCHRITFRTGDKAEECDVMESFATLFEEQARICS